MTRALLVLAGCCALEAGGCLDVGDPILAAEDVTAPAGPLDFEEHVLPVFERNGCVSCHGAGGGSAALDLTTAASVVQGGRTGPAVLPCDAAESRMQSRLDDCSMPPGPACVSEVEVALIARWIDQGARAQFDDTFCSNPPLE